MSTKLDILNFRNLREVHLSDKTKMSVIVGYNEAGKSSMAAALKWVALNSALDLRADELITWGEDRMHVRWEIAGRLFSRTRSGGDTIKEVAARLGVSVDVLPLLFDQRMHSDGGNKHMKAFLQGAVSDSFNAEEYFAKDPDIAPRIKRAKLAGKSTVKQIIKYCEEQRAATKPPPVLAMPSVPSPTDRELQAADAVVAMYVDALSSAEPAYTTACETRDAYARLVAYQNSVTAYDAARAAAAVGDPLADRRAVLEACVAVRVESLRASIEAIANAAPYLATAKLPKAELLAGLASALACQQEASAILKANPQPGAVPARPYLSPADQTVWTAVLEADKAPREVLQEAWTSAANQAEAIRVGIEAAKVAKKAAVAERDTLVANRGAWSAFKQGQDAYEEAKAAAEVEKQRWDNAAKAISNAEMEHMAAAGKQFETLITDFSKTLLNGRRVSVSPVDGIRLNNMDIRSASKSTQWRIEVCVMAAIAKYLGSPFLIIDEVDILDYRNTELFTSFLAENVVPFFDHVFVLATSKLENLEDEKPLGGNLATKWILNRGELVCRG